METSFGVQVEPQFGFDKKTIDLLANRVVKSSFDTIWVSDHMFLNAEAVNKVSFDAWTLITYLLTRYEELNVGSLVLCNSYRYPSILAKMITTLDNLSGGRFKFGYGAGWKKQEYLAYGINFEPFNTRITQLKEAIKILRLMWGKQQMVNFEGKYYRLKDAICYPKPFTKPYLPIWIGSNRGGSKMIRFAAKYGDGLNIAWSFKFEDCKRIFNELSEYAKDLGRNPDELKRSIGFWVRILEDEERMEAYIKEKANNQNISVKEYTRRIEGALVGTIDQIQSKLTKYYSLDISHFVFMFPYQKEVESLEVFSREILSEYK